MELRATRDIVIRTERFDEARAFYRDTLCLPLFTDDPDILGFDLGAIRLFVERGPAHAPIFELTTSDHDGARATLVQANAEVVEENPAIPRLYIRDPFGLTFNLARA